MKSFAILNSKIKGKKMPIVDRVLAEREIARLKKRKRPRVYCVVRYQDRPRSDAEKMAYSGYKICDRPDQYEALMRSNFVGGVDVLWASERFKAKQKEQQAEEDAREMASCFM